MNLLLAIVIAILIIYTLRGRRRGFILTVFTMFSTIIAILFTMWISPQVSKVIQNNEKVVTYVNENISGKLIFDDVGSKTTDEVEYIEDLPLPSLIKNKLVENNTNDVYRAMAVDSFKGYIGHMLTLLIINIAVFLLVCSIVKIVLYIISHILDLISNLPIINGLNRAAGLFVGFLHGIIVVWIGFVILTMFGNSQIGQIFFEQVNESEILSLLYNHNLIMNFLADVGKILF